MKRRRLGRTGLEVSSVAFGAGPIAGLMTAADGPDKSTLQTQTVARALALGINWFDTAPGYGDGASERALGHALMTLPEGADARMATKVRLTAEDLNDLPTAVEHSVEASLGRLGRERIDLLQLHNSITRRRGDLPTSLSVEDVLGSRGVAMSFEKLRTAGKVAAIGLTGLGHSAALLEVVESGRFDSVQLPLNLLMIADPSDDDSAVGEVPIGPIMAACTRQEMGVFAIRVLAGGALALAEPSEYTLRTKFFTADIYRRDLEAARALASKLPPQQSLTDVAVRGTLGFPGVTAAIIGFATPREVEAAVCAEARDDLSPGALADLLGG